MSKTLRRDKEYWMDNSAFAGFPSTGYIPIVKDVDGLKNRRDWTCKPGCRLCQRGPLVKRERMKKIRQSAAVDIAERM